MPDDTDAAAMQAAADAAGLTGRVTVYSRPAEINWTSTEALAPGVHSVAALPDYPEAQTICFVLPGDELFDGSPSPNLRVSRFTGNNNDIGTDAPRDSTNSPVA